MTAHLTQESARSLVDAGYMPLSEYIELCKSNGWKADMTDPTGNALRAHDMTQGSAATERPWICNSKNEIGFKIRSDDQSDGMMHAIADVFGENARNDAALIVTAVNERDQLLSDKAALEADNARLREALTPSSATKAAYIGEFKFVIDDDYEVSVPWTTIKEIMAAISARSALKGA